MLPRRKGLLLSQCSLIMTLHTDSFGWQFRARHRHYLTTHNTHMSHPRPRRIRNNYPSKFATAEKGAVDERANGVGCLCKYESELRFLKAGGWLNIHWNNLMKQAGDIATITSWYSVNLKLVKITGIDLSLPTQAGWFPRRCGEPEHICTGPVRDLHHHAQHFYSTILSNIANCCGHYKPIWTFSCNSHNISHCLCCKLAQVVALSSPPL